MKKNILFIILIFFSFNIIFAKEKEKLTLKDAIKIALQNNKEIKEAEKSILISKAKVKEIKAQKKLNLTLQGSYRRVGKEILFKSTVFDKYVLFTSNPENAIIDPQTNLPVNISSLSPLIVPKFPPSVVEIPVSEKKQESLNFSVSIPVYTWGKLEGAIKNADLSKDIDVLALEKIRQKIIFDTKQAYYNCLLAKEFVKVSEENLVKAREHYNAAKKKYELGAVAKFEVIRAEVEKASAEEDLIKAKKMLDLANMNFNNTLGLSLDEEVILEEDSEVEIKDFKLDECLSFALKERKEIAQLNIFEEQTKIAGKISRLLPTIGIKADYPFKSTGSTFSPEKVLSGVLFLDFPIFDSGASSARVHQAKESERKIKISKERTIDGIKLQIKEAYLSLQEAKKRIKTSEAILKQADEALRMAEIGYKEGVTSNLELIDARSAKTKAKLSYIQAIFDYKTSEAKLLFAMGKEE